MLDIYWSIWSIYKLLSNSPPTCLLSTNKHVFTINLSTFGQCALSVLAQASDLLECFHPKFFSVAAWEFKREWQQFRIYIWRGDLIEFFLFFISPVPIVNNCDVTILRDDFISSSPCSKAVLIVLIDSRVEVRSSSLQSDEPQVPLLSKWVHLFCSPFDIF